MNIFNGFFVLIASTIVFFHGIFSKIFGYNSGYTWGISIISLVVLIRVLLIPLFIKQMQSTMTMQKIYPEIKKIKEEYKYDKKEQQQQMMQLYSKHNANPLMGCLPLLIQSPFFISLFRVLESISHWTLNNHTTLYGPFKGNRTLVESAQHAQIFGAPIAVKITDSHEKLALMNANPLYAKLTIAFMIGVVLAIQIVSQRTMMKMQAQHATVEAEGAQKLQSKLIMYLLPIGTIFFGINMSAGVLLYWIVSYSFTFAQQTITLKVLHRNTIIQEKK